MRDRMRFVSDPPPDTLHNGETMRKMPNMKHEDPNTVSLEADDTARLSWRFIGDGTVGFACNIPVHFEAGMKHTIAIGTAP